MTRRRSILLALGALLLIGVLVFVTSWVVWRTAKRAIAREVLTPQETVVDISTLVTQVRELNRLETASMRVLHVGTVKQTYKMMPDALASDELTFLAAGDVIAGIDLAKLQPGDVWRESDGTIAMRLPPPQILVSRVDNKESRVLTRKTGVMRRPDVDLETRARQHAEENIRAEALKKGILKLAADNSEKKMAELLRTMGAERVKFVRSRPGMPEGAPRTGVN